MVSQAALESGWGKHESGKFNLSGIKGKGSTLNTREFINGKMTNLKDSFKDYKDYKDWAEDYINLLTNSRYGKAFSLPEQEFMPYIIKQGYATDPNYVNKYNKVLDKVSKMQSGGVLKYGDGNKVDPAILAYWKKQNIVLPESRHEQISADNRTKELRDYQNTQQQIDQNLEDGKYLNFWTQPYAGFSGRQAAELGNNLFKQSIYVGAGEVAGTYALQGLSKLSKFIPKRKVVKPVETKVGPKTYEELKIPGNESTKEVDAAIDYKKSSKPFKYDYSSIDNFYKSYFEDATITGEKLEKLDSGAKWIADNTFKGYTEHMENLESLITKTKGDKLKLIRHIKDDIPVGEYVPKRPLSFSFPEGNREFGRNRLIVEIPEEQSYLAIEKLLSKYPGKAKNVLDMVENEVLLPRKLRFQVTKAKKPNELGGDDYIGKILNPYLIPPITIPYDRKNN